MIKANPKTDWGRRHWTKDAIRDCCPWLREGAFTAAGTRSDARAEDQLFLPRDQDSRVSWPVVAGSPIESKFLVRRIADGSEEVPLKVCLPGSQILPSLDLFRPTRQPLTLTTPADLVASA